MKKIYTFLSVTIILLASGLRAQEVPREVLDLGLKVLVVNTVDGEEPTCESIYAPEGSWGVGITNVNKVPGSLSIVSPEGEVLYESGEYLKKESGMTIKVRGNTSAMAAKKPYKIKLEKKDDLLLRGDKKLRDKNWVLLSDRNMLLLAGFLTGEWVGMSWVPAWEPVNVMLNGRYLGLYLLAESVERNEDCRIQVDETGFITERDAYWWNQNGEYLESVWNPEFNWTMKYPDFEDLTEGQKTYIQGVMSAFEKISRTDRYEEMIDIDSFARWLIAQDILGTGDGGGTNLYLAKQDDSDDSKLYIPVLWDTDSAEDRPEAWSAVHPEPVIRWLFENSNMALKVRYVELYKEMADDIFGRWDAFIGELATDKWEAFDRSARYNNEAWKESNVNTAVQNISHFKWWFPARKRWLDAAVESLLEDINAVVNVGIDSNAGLAVSVDKGLLKVESQKEVAVYSIAGRVIYSGHAKEIAVPAGIYIVSDGVAVRKVIV